MAVKTYSHKVIIPGNYKSTLRYYVQHWIGCAQNAIATRGKFCVALSGGSTPQAIFAALSSPENSQRVDWDNVWIFWSDERSVPPTSPESNFRMAMDAGFEKLPIPKSQIFRMQAEEQIDKKALEYEKSIYEHVPNLSFDLIMLGMGEDGHTASLFPETEALTESERLVVANYVPEKETWRMTFTYPLIHRSKLNVIYILGSSKADVVHKAFTKKGKLPVQNVGTPESVALWIVDEDAAQKLT